MPDPLSSRQRQDDEAADARFNELFRRAAELVVSAQSVGERIGKLREHKSGLLAARDAAARAPKGSSMYAGAGIGENSSTLVKLPVEQVRSAAVSQLDDASRQLDTAEQLLGDYRREWQGLPAWARQHITAVPELQFESVVR